MEQVKVVSLYGPDSGSHSTGSNPTQALEELDRKALRCHLRHAGSWITRVALFTALIYSAIVYVAHPMGAVLSVVSGYLLLRSLLYCIKGHRKIAKYRKAKRFWLKAESGQQDIMAAELTVESGARVDVKKAG
jgi:hypothetical protein